jgi:predicted transcriptional regulator
MIEMSTVKEQAKKLIEQLPDDATWKDLLYEVYVRQEIEAGLRDLDAGRVMSQEDVEKRFLSPR